MAGDSRMAIAIIRLAYLVLILKSSG